MAAMSDAFVLVLSEADVDVVHVGRLRLIGHHALHRLSGDGLGPHGRRFLLGERRLEPGDLGVLRVLRFLLRNIAKIVAEWVCGQIGDVVANVVGKEFNRAAGGVIDKSIETLADEMSEEVCGLIKKGTSKNGGAGLTAGAYVGIVFAVIFVLGVLCCCWCRG